MKTVIRLVRGDLSLHTLAREAKRFEGDSQLHTAFIRALPHRGLDVDDPHASTLDTERAHAAQEHDGWYLPGDGVVGRRGRAGLTVCYRRDSAMAFKVEGPAVFSCNRCGDEVRVTEVTCDACMRQEQNTEAMRQACEILVDTFARFGDIADMDAADFKDRAGETWRAVLRAREALPIRDGE